MEELYKTIINDLLKRVDKLENKENTPNSFKEPNWKMNPNKPATDRQLNAVHKAGGEIWEGMTMGEITEQFNLINAQRKKDISEVPDGKYVDTRNKRGEEFKQGNTPNYVDSPVEIKLTEQEIKELEECGY